LYLTGGKKPDVLLIHPSPVQTRLIEGMENENPALPIMLVQPSDVTFSMLKLLQYPELTNIIVGLFSNIMYTVRPFMNHAALDKALHACGFSVIGERTRNSKQD